MPEDPRLWPSVGNGHVGTVVHSARVLVNGVYNGFGIKSHRAAIPSPVNINLTSTEPQFSFKSTYTLDIKQGLYGLFSRFNNIAKIDKKLKYILIY